MMTIGERIVELREKKGWSQRELARRVNLNASVMNRIEKDKRPVTDQEIKIFASILDVSADYLLGSSNLGANQSHASKDEKDIAKRLKEIRNDLTSGGALSFNGEPMSEEALESLMESMEHIVRQTQIINKKFIPKKYREEKDNQ
jgi:transcriptional regulator with XRE-family HTH domain